MVDSAFTSRFYGEIKIEKKFKEKLVLVNIIPVRWTAVWSPPTTRNTGEDLRNIEIERGPRPPPSQHSLNTLRLLVFMGFEFIVTNIPMAVVKICLACGLDSKNPGFKEFQTLSIVLEVFFAASDFYLFCFCHKTFRKKVSP